MTTQFLSADISHDEAPGGKPILQAYPDPLSPLAKAIEYKMERLHGLSGDPWTIGFGSTGQDVVEGTVWTEHDAAAARDHDIATLKEQCSHFPWWDLISDARQDVFIQMGYQMGFQGLLKFTATLAAAARNAWETVAADMKLSLWDKQTHDRAERLAEQMRTGVRLPQPYDDALVQPAPQLKETTVSFLSKFVFNPILAEIARGFSSSSATTQATATAAAGAVDAVTQPTVAPTGSSNSPLGNANDVIAQLENDLNSAVAAFVQATIAADVPVLGALIAPRAGELTKLALTFAENHALTYVAALFHFHKTSAAAVTISDGV